MAGLGWARLSLGWRFLWTEDPFKLKVASKIRHARHSDDDLKVAACHGACTEKP